MIIRLAAIKDIPHILQVVEDSYLPFAEQIEKIKVPTYTCEEIDSLIKDSGDKHLIWKKR